MLVKHNLNTLKQLFREKLCNSYELPEIDSIYKIGIEHIICWSRTEQIINAENEISSEKIVEIQRILSRLINNEPIQYIIGHTEFYNLNFKVNKSTLIPRQETELLVESIINSELPDSPHILDIGTGSGCIAIALKKNIPDARVTAMDVSERALDIAIENARENNTEITFIKESILKKQHSLDKYDLIVSNPPYVLNSEKAKMHDNVLSFEPELALFVSSNSPLVFYEAIAEFGQKHLNESGSIWIEINEAFGKETSKVFENMGFINTFIIKDLNDKDRFVKAWV